MNVEPKQVTHPVKVGPRGLEGLGESERQAYFKDRINSMTARQREICGLLCVGFATADIARILKTTPGNVRKQLSECDGYGFRAVTPAARQQLMAGAWEQLHAEALALARRKMGDASFMQLVTSGAIASDKVHRHYATENPLSDDSETTEIELRIRKRLKPPSYVAPP